MKNTKLDFKSVAESIEKLNDSFKLSSLEGRKFGKTLITVELLQKFLEQIPEKIEPPKILIVGMNEQRVLSKHMELIMRAASERGVDIHFMSAKSGSVEKVFKVDTKDKKLMLLNGLCPTLGPSPLIGCQTELTYLTGTPKLSNKDLIIDHINSFKNLNYELGRFDDIGLRKIIAGEKHVPIKGKSSRKGKNNNLGSKFHK